MEQILNIEEREGFGTSSSKRLRRVGKIPCVLYGKKKDNISFAIPDRDFLVFLHSGAKIATLKLKGKKENAILKDVQYDAFGERVLHADFYRFEAHEKIKTRVSIRLTGEAKGIAEGGIVEHDLKEIEVECLASRIPEEITVDITNLGIGDVIRVKDLRLPEEVGTSHSKEGVVVKIHEPKEEAVEALPEEVKAEPEVIGEKKEALEKKPEEKKEVAEKKKEVPKEKK